jgi:hypothetical protein
VAVFLRRIADEIREQLDSDLVPPGDARLLFDIYAVLALALGEKVTATDVHNAWAAWMAARDPDHPSLVPFNELDRATAAADKPFVEAIRVVARNLSVDRAVTRDATS